MAKAKKRVSKKTKKSWRKNVDVSDIDAFLDDKRRAERLGIGSIAERKDEQLFTVDLLKGQTKTDDLRCFKALNDYSAIPDPMKKRNVIRKKTKNFVTKKELVKHFKSRLVQLKNNRRNKRRAVEKWSDPWIDTGENKVLEKRKDWFENNTELHVIRNMSELKECSTYRPSKPCTPKFFQPPHPGISYNPSFKDHMDLLQEIAKNEEIIRKQECHLERVTQKMKRGMNAVENQKIWMREMSEGILRNEDDDDDVKDEEMNREYKALNAPTTREKKKTIKQRKKEKRRKKEEAEQEDLKEEQKKLEDIRRINEIEEEIAKEEEMKERKIRAREKRVRTRVTETKRICRKQLDDDESEFTAVEELSGNLREIIPQGNILRDAFRSFQKRNVIEVMKPQFKSMKKSVKKYQTASHRPDPIEFSIADTKKNLKILAQNEGKIEIFE